jgi:DNA-directed RNA polymerase specialized sigma subunit
MAKEQSPGADWEKQLRAVVRRLEATNAQRIALLEERRKLLVEGWMAGHATQVRIADMTGLSRGRVQQLIDQVSAEA